MTNASIDRFALAAFLVFASLAPTLQGQDEGEPREATTDLPHARSIIDRFLEVAHHDKVVETDSVHVVGTIAFEALEIEGKLESWKARPNLYRVRVEFGSSRSIVESGFDGKVAWTSNPILGGARVLKSAERLEVVMEALYQTDARPRKYYEEIKTVAREEFAGVDCYKVKFVVRAPVDLDAKTTLRTRTSYSYYEVESGLLKGSDETRFHASGGRPVREVIESYRELAGVLVPVRTVQTDATSVVVISIQSVDFGPVDDARFEPPEGVE